MERRWLVLDVVGAIVVGAISAAVAAPTDPAAYALTAIACGAFAVRRLVPLPAAAVSLGATLVYAAADFPEALPPVGILAVYTAASRCDGTAARWLLAGAVVVTGVTATLGPGATDATPPVVAAAAWQLGRSVRSRRLYAEELERKNAELERAQQDLARHAVTEERLRIARELHDVVAHSMGVVAVQAGSGRMVAESDPAAARRALETIEDTTRNGLHEMRRLLGVLRETDGAELAPAPGLADLDGLVADARRAGVEVDVRIEGEPRPLPPGVDLSAYRIVQEALTNVVRHAGPAACVALTVRHRPDAVELEIVDDGLVPPATTGGHGLAGMRERAALHGGTLDVGPRREGGWRVAARLPLT